MNCDAFRSLLLGAHSHSPTLHLIIKILDVDVLVENVSDKILWRAIRYNSS